MSTGTHDVSTLQTYRQVMDETLDRLPPVYAAFLRLERAGVSPEVIATQLDVELDALPLLAELARAKLAQARSDCPGPAREG